MQTPPREKKYCTMCKKATVPLYRSPNFCSQCHLPYPKEKGVAQGGRKLKGKRRTGLR
jgi:hypothetical protein